MKPFILLIALFMTLNLTAQVGIGTTSPNATLDIRASNQSTPSNTDGILIPKIDDFPTTDPAAAQDGMLVYVTGDGTPTKGYYYWDNAGTSWETAIGSSATKINELTDGKSDSDGSNDGSSIFLGVSAGVNDDLTDNGNVGVGYFSMSSNTSGLANTAVGWASLWLNTNGTRNTAIGARSMFDNVSGSFNTAMGHSSLENNTTGIQNTALGRNTMLANTTANNNTAVGAYSAASNTTGEANSSLGTSAIGLNTNGSNNTAIGFEAGQFDSGDGGVFVGARAGRSETTANRLYIENSDADANNALIYGEFDNDILRTNGTLQIGNPSSSGYALPTADGTANQVLATDGSGQLTFTTVSGSGANNINELSDGKTISTSLFLGQNAGANDDASDNKNLGIGSNSLNATTSGFNNNAIGNSALAVNTTGYSNVANGAGALSLNTTGYGNVAIGDRTLENTTTGTRNIAVGRFALNANTTGSSNIAIGEQALENSTTVGLNVAVGSSALTANTTGNNNTAIGGNVLRSNTTARSNTAVGMFSMANNTEGEFNSAIGTYTMQELTTGDGNVAIGSSALTFNSTGNSNTAIGRGSGYNALGSSNIFIGANAGYGETGSNKLYIENSNTTTPLIYATFNTNEVGINWDRSTALPNTLSVNGTASKSTAGSWVANSDRRLKKEIKTIAPQDALLKIMNMRGVTYKWNDAQTGVERPTEIQYGFVAQEIMEVFPEKVTKDGQGFYQTAYGDYDALFVQAIKELQDQLKEKEKQIEVLKKELIDRITALETKLTEITASN